MERTIVILAGLLLSSVAVADDGATTCSIEIRDIRAGTSRSIGHRFSSPNEAQTLPQGLHFELPGSDHKCTLAFFGRTNGTALSCEHKDSGWTYLQSDRSALPDTPPITNNLSFRHNASQISVKTTCE